MRHVWALLLLPLFACDTERAGTVTLDLRHNPRNEGTAVAKFEGDSISAEQLQAKFLEMAPPTRAHYQTVEAKKDFVKGTARFQVLVNEAVRRGLHQDPQVVESLKKQLVARLIQDELEKREGKVTDEQLKEYYQSHLADYVSPEKLRLFHIFLAAPEGDAAARKEKKAKAEALLEQVTATKDMASFAALARTHSEEKRTQPLDGDMRFLSAEELARQYGAPVAEAAAQLKETGDVFPKVVATPAGFHILRLQQRQPARNIAFEQVKEGLLTRLTNERRMRGYDAFIDDLLARAKYEVDEDVLRKMQIDLKAPIQKPQGPAQGFVPGAR